ncbi:hypothetical protein EGJ27_21605 [Pseudomonas sp. v388]|nr:hypothetical protein EGJ27_21605 [Pseudomonas sp. v388]
MIDQASQFFAVLTDIGVAKQAKADALGIPWKITQMAVGDANGTDPLPDVTQLTLIHEQRRAPLNQLKVDPNNRAMIIAEQVIPAEVGGWWIREIGLLDEDDDLVAIANCAPSFKPLLAQGSGRTQVVRINLVVTNTSNVVLKIDPSVVLATRRYVDEKIVEEMLSSAATEQLPGTAKIASLKQVEEGADDTAIVTPKKLRMGFRISLGANGFIAFPTWLGGLIIQWVTGTASAQPHDNFRIGELNTWPLSYPNAVYIAVATHQGNAPGTYLTWTDHPQVPIRTGILVGSPGWTTGLIAARIISIGS